MDRNSSSHGGGPGRRRARRRDTDRVRPADPADTMVPAATDNSTRSARPRRALPPRPPFSSMPSWLWDMCAAERAAEIDELREAGLLDDPTWLSEAEWIDGGEAIDGECDADALLNDDPEELLPNPAHCGDECDRVSPTSAQVGCGDEQGRSIPDAEVPAALTQATATSAAPEPRHIADASVVTPAPVPSPEPAPAPEPPPAPDYIAWSDAISSAPPGPELAKLLAAPPSTPDPNTSGEPLARSQTLIAILAARQRLIQHLEAAQSSTLRELVRSYPGDLEFLSTEIAQSLGIGEATAGNHLVRAAETGRLHGTRAAWQAGQLSTVKVNVLRENLHDHDAETIDAVEKAVLGDAGHMTVPQLRAAVQSELIRHDCKAMTKRHEAAKAERHVRKYSLPDGMAGLSYHAPAEDVAAVWTALTCFADAAKTQGDDRDIDARRADALRDLCVLPASGSLATDHPSRKHRRALVHVTMPVGALLGSDEPCQLAGYGMVTADQARRIATDADLRRLLCDPTTGQLVGLDSTRYRPPASLVDFVQTRDATCVVPGCLQVAWRCEIDHRERFSHGGLTTAENLSCLCKHHHRAKDKGGYILRRNDSGDYQWITPLGTTVVRRATRHWVAPGMDPPCVDSPITWPSSWPADLFESPENDGDTGGCQQSGGAGPPADCSGQDPPDPPF